MLLRDRVYQAIRQSILTCELKPGQDLREQALAERYRVSRSPIRDSLLRLEQENLVIVLPRQGYRITPISLSDVRDVSALRLVIEPACAVAAAQADEVASRTLDEFRDLPDHDIPQAVFATYNSAFHNAVAMLSANKQMVAVAADLIDQSTRFIWASLPDVDDETINTLMTEHRLIIDAIQSHDGELAYSRAYSHAELGNKVVLAVLQKSVNKPDGPTITE